MFSSKEAVLAGVVELGESFRGVLPCFIYVHLRVG